MTVYDEIETDLVSALEGVDVLNNTDIGRLDVNGLTETARLIAILERRVKRLCVMKLDQVKASAFLYAGLETGQRLMGKSTDDASAKHKSLLDSQHALEKYATQR